MTQTCRNCGNPSLEEVLSLGTQPLANAFLTEQTLDLPEARYPLSLAFCSRCCLAQISESVDPSVLFRDYPYFSSVSDAFVLHAKRLTERLVELRQLSNSSLVVEIGSNDGYLLQHYARRGIPVLGIEPARNVAATANRRGVPTIAEFFDLNLAESLRASGRAADVIHANNVMAHVPDLHAVVAGIATVLKPTGLAVIETPYVRDLVERLEFDTIYHEHVFYYSLTSLARILEGHGLVVLDVERLAVHGGSLRIFAGHAAGPPVESSAVRQMLAAEAAIELCSAGYFRDFASRVESLGNDLRALLDGLRGQGKTIAAYGAAAKGTVLLNAFSIDRKTIDFVADRSPRKHGLFMPGVRIPIVPTERLVELSPDACLLLSWNFAGEILAQQIAYTNRGGRFIVPVPVPTILESPARV